MERYPGLRFANADRLAVGVLRSKLHDILARAGPVERPRNLPHLSLGALFKGRESRLDEMVESLNAVPQESGAAVAVRVLTGLGGVGKTRLALEYAWRRQPEYTALLFAGADSPEALDRNLAALCGTGVLDLPEKAETDESRQRAAVFQWLRAHPGWLLILDNADTKDAAAAVERLLPQLSGGHVLVTSRLAGWSAGVQALPVQALLLEAAAAFLLERTAERRRVQGDDPAAVRTLAGELGRLALALEQAGAYIFHHRSTFAQYLADWRNRRDKVLAWFDPRVMQYPWSVAVTWQTSVDQLGDDARRLLERLAWLAPDPIPESLLHTPIPGSDADVGDLFGALAELEAYSLATRSADAPMFEVHRLVQDVTRRSLPGEARKAVLNDALAWMGQAFTGDPDDVRNWSVLEPLAPHARAAAAHGDAAGITEPISRLFNQVGLLLFAKALYTEAEPLMRRALGIDEASYGADHPGVAIRLNNLASLLQETNRLGEAEPLMRRALEIDEASYGADHPGVAIRLNNLASLLQETNRPGEAEPLMRRALGIDEASYGADHPEVAVCLNNLALLLQETNRPGEAEPLMRRALAMVVRSLSAEHPHSQTAGENYFALLRAMGRTGDEIGSEFASLLLPK